MRFLDFQERKHFRHPRAFKKLQPGWPGCLDSSPRTRREMPAKAKEDEGVCSHTDCVSSAQRHCGPACRLLPLPSGWAPTAQPATRDAQPELPLPSTARLPACTPAPASPAPHPEPGALPMTPHPAGHQALSPPWDWPILPSLAQGCCGKEHCVGSRESENSPN